MLGYFDTAVDFIISVEYVDNNGNYVYGVPSGISVYRTSQNRLYYYSSSGAAGTKIRILYHKIS